MPKPLKFEPPHVGSYNERDFSNMLLARGICFRLGWLAVIGVAARLSAAEPNGASIEFFERKVRPLLAENCYSCHGEEKQKNHLRLDSPAAIRVGGESGAAI